MGCGAAITHKRRGLGLGPRPRGILLPGERRNDTRHNVVRLGPLR